MFYSDNGLLICNSHLIHSWRWLNSLVLWDTASQTLSLKEKKNKKKNKQQIAGEKNKQTQKHFNKGLCKFFEVKLVLNIVWFSKRGVPYWHIDHDEHWSFEVKLVLYFFTAAQVA